MTNQRLVRITSVKQHLNGKEGELVVIVNMKTKKPFTAEESQRKANKGEYMKREKDRSVETPDKCKAQNNSSTT